MNEPDPLSHLFSNFQATLSLIGTFNAPEALNISKTHIRLLTGLPHPFANLLMPADMSPEEFESLLQETEQWSRKQQAPVAMILFPEIIPDTFSRLAMGRDWLLLDKMPGMWLAIEDATALPELAAGVRITVTHDESTLAASVLALAEGYPVPPEVADLWMRGFQLAGAAHGGRLANFVATVGDEPAACASLNLRNGVAGIYCVATREAYRRRGLGAAVTLAAVEHARKLGASHALLHATEMGHPVYRRIGFATRNQIPVLGFGLG